MLWRASSGIWLEGGQAPLQNKKRKVKAEQEIRKRGKKEWSQNKE